MPILFTARVAPLQSIAFNALLATYLPLGVPFGGTQKQPMRMIKLLNTTDKDVFISFDNVNDNDVLPENGGFALYDLYSNDLALQNLTTIYAKLRVAGAPSQGAVYLVGLYGK